MLRGLLYASDTRPGGASPADGSCVPCQVLMTTTSHIPVVLSFCHFVTLGRYGTITRIFP